MPAYSGALPTDSASKKFEGGLANNGGTNEFDAFAGVNRRTQNAEVVVDLQVQVGTELGAGATIGATGDAAVEGDNSGTLSGKLRGLTKILGAVADSKVITDAAGSISGKLRGLVYFAERLDAVLGLTSDVALAPDNSGSLSAKVRSLTKIFGATDDAGVSTDANGTVSAKLRGIIILVVNLLSRWPASLGQKAMAASLAVVLPSDQSAIPVTDNGGSLTVDGAVAATQSGAWSITNVSGTVSLPTGAATETTLASANTKLASLQPAATGTYATAATVGSAAGGQSLCGVAASRKRVELVNNSSVRVYLGFDNTLTAGANGKNIGSLGPYEGRSFEYTGAMYGITMADTAYVAVAEMS